MTSLTRTPACPVKFCPVPRDPDWHECWCGAKEIEHHHVESRGMGGSKLQKHIVALCHKHHEAVTLHECYDLVTVFDWETTYTYMDKRGDVLHEQVLDYLPNHIPGNHIPAKEVMPNANSRPQRHIDQRVEEGVEAGQVEAESVGAEAVLAARPMPNASAHGGSSAPTPSVSAKSPAGEGAYPRSRPPVGDGAVAKAAAAPSPAEPFLEAWCQRGMKWVYLGLTIKAGMDDWRFAVGDWFNEGEQVLSDEAYGYLRPFRDETVRQYAWVAGTVARPTRVTELPWTYHRAVAALPEPKQKEWLERAQEEKLSSKELNRAIHGEPTAKERHECPLCQAEHVVRRT